MYAKASSITEKPTRSRNVIKKTIITNTKLGPGHLRKSAPEKKALVIYGSFRPIKTPMAPMNSLLRIIPLGKSIRLPSELQLSLMRYLSSQDLCNVRLICKRWNILSCYLLRIQISQQINRMTEERQIAQLALLNNEMDKRQPLAHYREFLTNITGAEISEAMHYNSPPPELQTVCECLCILKGCESTSSRNKEYSPMAWPAIRKHMSRYDFKTWLVGLRHNVEFVQLANVKRVSHIIITDPSITYDRLRDVSLTGYRLLIVVAAVLQYCQLSEDLKIQRRTLTLIESRLNKKQKFITLIKIGPANELALPVKKTSLPNITDQIAKAALI